MTGMVPKHGAGAIRAAMFRQARDRIAHGRADRRHGTPWPAPRPTASGWSIGPDGRLHRSPAPSASTDPEESPAR